MIEKTNKINYDYFHNFWKQHFLNQKYILKSDNIGFLSFIKDSIRIDIYLGNYRKDTETHGCIAIDLIYTWNEIEQCPIYFDLTIDTDILDKAINMLIKAGREFSVNCGKIILENNELKYKKVYENGK